MKSYKQFLTWLTVMSALLLFSACDSNNNDTAAPGINGQDLEVSGGRGTGVDINFTLEAEEGIQSLTLSVDGGNPETLEVNEGATSQEFTPTFLIPAESVLGAEFSLLFTLTDEAGQESEISAKVITDKLIETPATYEFSRNGESTVHHPGQTDRLDMVEEIKDYIRQGDRGEVVFEQDFLDMFENTGGNGGGNFSFTSDRQLKNKTFTPDLDNQLFEDLFARAAAASVDGSTGVTASNGTAGLIVRENSGNTILVDENGREFTQFIE